MTAFSRLKAEPPNIPPQEGGLAQTVPLHAGGTGIDTQILQTATFPFLHVFLVTITIKPMRGNKANLVEVPRL